MRERARLVHRITAVAIGVACSALILWVIPSFRLYRECAGWTGWTEWVVALIVLAAAAGMSLLARFSGWLPRDQSAGFLIIVFVSSTAVVFATLLLLPEYFDRSKNPIAETNMKQMRHMANQLLEYSYDTDEQLPETSSIAEFKTATNGALNLPRNDAWGNPYLLRTYVGGFDLISFGQCGESDTDEPRGCMRRSSEDFTTDLVILGGEWCSWHGLPDQHPEHR